MMKFIIELDILYLKKVVLQIVLIIVLKESELIHIIFCLQKKIPTFHSIIILIKSIVNKKKNHRYYIGFLKKDSYKDKSNT